MCRCKVEQKIQLILRAAKKFEIVKISKKFRLNGYAICPVGKYIYTCIARHSYGCHKLCKYVREYFFCTYLPHTHRYITTTTLPASLKLFLSKSRRPHSRGCTTIWCDFYLQLAKGLHHANIGLNSRCNCVCVCVFSITLA